MPFGGTVSIARVLIWALKCRNGLWTKSSAGFSLQPPSIPTFQVNVVVSGSTLQLIDHKERSRRLLVPNYSLLQEGNSCLNLIQEMSKNDERPNEDNPSTDEHSQVVEECITVNQDFDNEEQDGPEEDEEAIEDVEGENDQKGCMYRCLTRVGCSYVANLPARWPRTCGILLGVVS